MALHPVSLTPPAAPAARCGARAPLCLPLMPEIGARAARILPCEAGEVLRRSGGGHREQHMRKGHLRPRKGIF